MRGFAGLLPEGTILLMPSRSTGLPRHEPLTGLLQAPTRFNVPFSSLDAECSAYADKH
jgi:hypothetical protein